MTPYGVLFVCTGNICRSPTAEGVFRHYMEAEGLHDHFHIDSAGTHGYHEGDPPDRRAIAAARARGVKLDELRARSLSRRDFDAFDLIVAMDRGHHEIMEAMAPEGSRAALALFMDFVPDRAGMTCVPDPYYGGARDFEHVLDLAEKGAKGLLARLRGELRL